MHDKQKEKDLSEALANIVTGRYKNTLQLVILTSSKSFIQHTKSALQHHGEGRQKQVTGRYYEVIKQKQVNGEYFSKIHCREEW